MNNKETTKLTAGEAFQLALSIQFALILIAAVVLLFKAAANDTLTAGKFFIGLAVCYNAFLPVLFARCLASIERNTAQNSNQAETKAAPVPVPPVVTPAVVPVSSTPNAPIDTAEKATVIGDTVICPNCKKQQKKGRVVCFECGTSLKTE